MYSHVQFCHASQLGGRLAVDQRATFNGQRLEGRARRVSACRKIPIVRAETDSSGMSSDQVQKGIDIQLKQVSSVEKPAPPPAASVVSEEGSGSETEAPPTPEQESANQEASEGIQQEVVGRVGLMSDSQSTDALERQFGASHADWSGDEGDEPEPEPEPEPESEVPEASSGTEMEDGSVMFTAEELQAVSYDDLSPST